MFKGKNETKQAGIEEAPFGYWEDITGGTAGGLTEQGSRWEDFKDVAVGGLTEQGGSALAKAAYEAAVSE